MMRVELAHTHPPKELCPLSRLFKHNSIGDRILLLLTLLLVAMFVVVMSGH